MKQKRSLFGILASYLKMAWDDIVLFFRMLANPRKRRQVWGKSVRFMRVFIGKIISLSVPKEAASLTYITLLGFVPFITFIFMITPDLPFLNIKEKLRDILASNMMPGSASAVMQYIDEFIARRTAFNIMSFVILIVTSYSLFLSIRNTFDRILSTASVKSADIITQLIKFFGTIILGLIIMVMLFSSSSLPVISVLLNLPILKQINYFVPFILQFLGIVFLYTLFPSIRVSRRSLFRGAFWTTVVWVLVKSLFDLYIYNLTSIQKVYGVMAALPIFLTWIYFNWIVIVGGIVLVSVLENGGTQKLEDLPRQKVRLTVEMLSDDKLNRKLEGIVEKEELIGILKEQPDTEER